MKATSAVAVTQIDESNVTSTSTGSTDTAVTDAALPAPTPAPNQQSDAALVLLGLGGIAVNSADSVAGSNVPGSPPSSDVPSA